VKELVDGKLQKLTDVLLSLSVIVQKHAVVSCNALVIFVDYLLLFALFKFHRLALFPCFLANHHLQDRVHHFLLSIFSSSIAVSSPYSQNSPHMPQAY
jgi:hypothetical protein